MQASYWDMKGYVEFYMALFSWRSIFGSGNFAVMFAIFPDLRDNLWEFYLFYKNGIFMFNMVFRTEKVFLVIFLKMCWSLMQ